MKEWVKPVCYCEIDSYCRKVLSERMAEKKIEVAPIWKDVTTLEKKWLDEEIKEKIDIIYGGFPCQDISIIKVGKGLEGNKSKLFFEMLRLTKEIRPPFVFIENVPAITRRGGIRIIREITSLGYDCRWGVISAKNIGAPHCRKRWFCLAHSNGASGPRLCGGEEKGESLSVEHIKSEEWHVWPQGQSQLLRMDDGISNRMDRTKALGNAVVPLQCKKAFEILSGLKK